MSLSLSTLLRIGDGTAVTPDPAHAQRRAAKLMH